MTLVPMPRSLPKNCAGETEDDGTRDRPARKTADAHDQHPAALLLLVVPVGAVSTHVLLPPIEHGGPAFILLVLSAYPADQYVFVPHGAGRKIDQG